jgi:hypothetical protein
LFVAAPPLASIGVAAERRAMPLPVLRVFLFRVPSEIAEGGAKLPALAVASFHARRALADERLKHKPVNPLF